jgi:hypothetical protein
LLIVADKQRINNLKSPRRLTVSRWLLRCGQSIILETIMAKRNLIFAAFLLLFAGSIFAQEFSAGVGGHFTADWTTYSLTSDGEMLHGKAEKKNMQFMAGGFYGFFDATYVVANIGLAFDNTNNIKQDNFSDALKKGIDYTALKLGLFFKYPIALDGFTIFPLLGLDNTIVLAGKMYGDTVDEDAHLLTPALRDFQHDYSQYWLKLGVGADFDITDSIYLRPEFLYGFALNNRAATALRVKDGSAATHGLDVKLSLGFRL